ncbi:hypothetical protein [Zhongshania borealis]|uniref:Uncharacterized protein n=1 Tax=Zhongshania borealis TaxID=889488 RepID=A0ABP7WRW1_9GAMM
MNVVRLNNLALPAIIAALLFSISSISAYADKKDINRQENKLKARGIETLPTQALVDIYNACLHSALRIEEDAAIELSLSTSVNRANLSQKETTNKIKMQNLTRHCQNERKELSKRTADQFVDTLDDLFEKETNIYLSGKDAKKTNKKSDYANTLVVSPTSKDLTPKPQTKPKTGREMTDVGAGPVLGL